jgi:hypothetical protein
MKTGGALSFVDSSLFCKVHLGSHDVVAQFVNFRRAGDILVHGL